MKKLCQMLTTRDCHGAEIFEDKVMIWRGEGSQGKLCWSLMQTKIEYLPANRSFMSGIVFLLTIRKLTLNCRGNQLFKDKTMPIGK